MTANEGTKREKRGRGLSVPVMMRLSDCAVRFLLAAVLAGAELMGGHALFALALVGDFIITAMSSIPSRSAVAEMQNRAASVEPVLRPVAPS